MESISKISSILDTARELTLEAAQSASSGRSFASRSTARDPPFASIKKLLDSRNDREILEGLRKVISMIYRSKPCLPFFSSIVKNVASPNIEIKKLVYIYLLHYAESEPDLALLSINTIQKSLSDQSPQVRALALRVMSGIRVPVISQIVSLAIKKGCGDMSPFVRKAAALAIPKCYRLDPNTLPQLLDYLTALLGDKQYFVAGSAVIAFLEVCPDRIDLLHKHYRGLVRKLVDMDEWGQLATLKLMITYCRKCFPRRTTRVKTEIPDLTYHGESTGEKAHFSGEEVQELDPDLEIFLKACKNLLQSRNSAVVVSVARCFFYLGTREHMEYAAGPVVALLRSPPDIQQVALANIVAFGLEWPKLFIRYATHFLVHGTDSTALACLKFEILTLIFPHCEEFMKEMILGELRHFTRASNNELVQAAVQAIGRCAQHDPKASARCMQLLFKHMSSQDGNLVAESVTVIRHLIQQAPQSHIKTVIRLAKNLDTTVHAEARASIIWLVGEFAGIGGEDNIAPDVLRILAKNFVDESEAAKLQIILLAAKVYLHYLLQHPPKLPSPEPTVSSSSPITINAFSLPAEEGGFQSFSPSTPSPEEAQSSSIQSDPEHPIPKLWNYILLLAHYDTSYDLRDRTRTYKALLSNPSTTQLASLMLLAPKPVPRAPSPSEARAGLLLGSSSLVIGTPVTGYEPLPDWIPEGQEPDKRCRDEGNDAADSESRNVISAADRLGGGAAIKGSSAGRGTSVAEGKQPAKGKSLDDWLAEEDEEDEDEEDEDEGSDEESESESEFESEEEEEDDDDENSQEDSASDRDVHGTTAPETQPLVSGDGGGSGGGGASSRITN